MTDKLVKDVSFKFDTRCLMLGPRKSRIYGNGNMLSSSMSLLMSSSIISFQFRLWRFGKRGPSGFERINVRKASASSRGVLAASSSAWQRGDPRTLISFA